MVSFIKLYLNFFPFCNCFPGERLCHGDIVCLTGNHSGRKWDLSTLMFPQPHSLKLTASGHKTNTAPPRLYTSKYNISSLYSIKRDAACMTAAWSSGGARENRHVRDAISVRRWRAAARVGVYACEDEQHVKISRNGTGTRSRNHLCSETCVQREAYQEQSLGEAQEIHQCAISESRRWNRRLLLHSNMCLTCQICSVLCKSAYFVFMYYCSLYKLLHTVRLLNHTVYGDIDNNKYYRCYCYYYY